MQLKFAAIMMAGAMSLTLAACIPSAPEPTPAPSPTARAAPAAPRPVDSPVHSPVDNRVDNWMELPLTAGNWSHRTAGGNSVAQYSSPSQGMILQMTCTPARQIVVALAVPGAGSNAIRILTETADRTVPVQAGTEAVSVTLASRDPLLDAITFSNGRFAVAAPGRELIVAPAWPEITRVIEDCRS